MRRPLVLAENFRSFADLAAAYDEGADYSITCVTRPDPTVGIVAQHGGRIEARTVEIATDTASEDISLYVLEGICSMENSAAPHLTSHCLDEPDCLELLTCDTVFAIRVCHADGEVVLLGGLDKELAAELRAAMTKAGLKCYHDGHRLPGTHPNNICDRGRRQERKLVAAVREVVLERATRRTPPGVARPSV